MDYIKNPNLPNLQIRNIIANDIYGVLKNYNVINPKPVKSLPKPEQMHADLQIVHLGNNTFFSSIETFDYYSDKLKDSNLLKSTVLLNNKYPQNVLLNVCVIGDYIICNKKTIDSSLMDMANKLGFKLINVNQGYAKCSIAVVSKNAIITSDPGITKALQDTDIDVLTIQSGYIALQGYDYGFIGGTCGKISNNTVLFYGDITAHPNFKSIFEFLEKHGCKAQYFSDFPLTDIGSIIPLF